ncbi:hypothetical protein K443DRAFT_598320 [Laccaria amethystina LaAM-08-1]|uniref:E2 ubiquitin-conjugating enzyme n=1 Tax=Laccaria amethystina LaAM-08-1 TaxID=1095629 RepID=A0A0C9XSB8_9AGAR|nr:hypothetical protein K443DRAFT_598320 [Laccaria amethystina LaAM-08-1]
MPPALSSTMTMKRIHREIGDLKKEDLGAIVLAPTEENLYLWKGSIPGPEGSVYEGGVFNVEVVLPPDYPFTAPKAMFKTRIYHMNISEQGNICIDILKQNWSPALSLFKVMLSLSSLLTDPNPKDPLVPSIATQYTRNRQLHDTTARQWTQLYALPPKPIVVPSSPPPKVSKAKGKKRAEAPPTTSRGSSSRATRSTASAAAPVEAADGVIVLDSEDEAGTSSAVARGKRKRREEPNTAASGSGSSARTQVLELGSDNEGGSSRAPTAPSQTRKRQKRGANKQLGDVIVIEDD